MKTHTQVIGDDLTLTIPERLATESGIAAHTEVEISVEAGRLVVRPKGGVSVKLQRMLGEVTDENVPGEWDTGPSVGNEVW